MDGEVKQNYELAFDDYQKGMKYKEIAEKYGVSLSAVKSWASRYWKKKKGCNPNKSQMKKVATKGGQPGNKNAVGNKGGAAPEQNKNALKTGEFETLFFKTLNPEEKELVSLIQTDKEQLLLQEIQLLTVREHRMLKRIEDLKQSCEDVVEDKAPAGMTVVKFSYGLEKGQPTALRDYESILVRVQSIEDALTRVQEKKQRAIETLHKFGYDDARLELETMRFEMELMKQDGTNEEIADDGFLKAMNHAVDVWADEDE